MTIILEGACYRVLGGDTELSTRPRDDDEPLTKVRAVSRREKQQLSGICRGHQACP
ncbi:hypothetical protein [Streptomyces hundungensis]|uniref:hypothetical protein n=1 Tax=Streptomyces hundungensis TaxID=1077946 RepID=UPI0013C4F168|nr:hypothetical protein [Streptomyces hundungensis]